VNHHGVLGHSFILSHRSHPQTQSGRRSHRPAARWTCDPDSL
jgi:hypothetical protein